MNYSVLSAIIISKQIKGKHNTISSTITD